MDIYLDQLIKEIRQIADGGDKAVETSEEMQKRQSRVQHKDVAWQELMSKLLDNPGK